MNNIYPVQTKVSKNQREALFNQRAILIWFTGLSGSGKSTLAVNLEAALHLEGFKTYLLDGDNIRFGLNQDLSFDEHDRTENIRRIGEVSKILLDAGLVVMSASISPFLADRQRVKEIVGTQNYFEVFIDCPIHVCEQRDVKGLYQRARRGIVKNFTGIDSPYEEPVNPDIVIHTDKFSIDHSKQQLLNFIIPRIIP